MAERDEYDDDFDNESDNSPLVKDLRKQLRQAKKDLDSLTEQVKESQKSSRERNVRDVLEAKGVRPSIAKYIPDSVDSEDAILSWLESNADDFGIDLSGEVAAPDPGVADRQRADALSSRAVTPSRIADFESRMAKAESDEEIVSIINEARQYIL
jgi:hypothetical protein